MAMQRTFFQKNHTLGVTFAKNEYFLMKTAHNLLAISSEIPNFVAVKLRKERGHYILKSVHLLCAG